MDIDESVRPRKSNRVEVELRKLWGLEDEEDEFGEKEGRTSDEQRMFDEAGKGEDDKEEERRDKMINWERYEDEGVQMEQDNEEE